MSVESGYRGESHEQALSQRICAVRFGLAMLNFLVIFLDQSVPASATRSAYAWAYAGAAAVFLYALAAFLSVRRRWIDAVTALNVLPFLDIGCGAALILATDGHQSPFGAWLICAVVYAGFSRRARLVFVVTALALITHGLIALVPQDSVLDVTVFTVRTGYWLGLAVLLGSIGSWLATYSKGMSVVSAIGEQLAHARTHGEVFDIVRRWALGETDMENVRVESLDGEPTAAQRVESHDPQQVVLPLLCNGRAVGRLLMRPRSPFQTVQAQAARLICERATAAMQRIELTASLAAAAAGAERARMMDALHDTSLQTLAALDMRLATLNAPGNGQAFAAPGALADARRLCRQAVEQARAFLRGADEPIAADATAVCNELKSRWDGRASIDIPVGLNLTPEQWKLALMLVREGSNNAVRHGSASTVAFRICQTDNGDITCTLANDGQRPRETTRLGFGLGRLQQRVRELGGKLRLEAMKSGGAILEVQFAPTPSSSQENHPYGR